jgi:putative DNA primase/helicase
VIGVGTAFELINALGGRNGVCRCPAHDDNHPSLSINDDEDGNILVHCFAGCDQAQVISVLRSRGLWKSRGVNENRRGSRKRHQSADNASKRDDTKRTESALRIWRSSVPAPGTLVEIYLKSRSLRLQLPTALRFHAALKHHAGGFWPAMVALVSRGQDGSPLAIHRTFLARDGSGKASVGPQKMMLGPCGGGAVRLGDSGDVLMVGEGIETCLAAMQATGNPAWAALSTSGLRALNLPDTVHEVIVLADGDAAGEKAAHDAARRWQGQGLCVRIANPGNGLDFNDLLLGRTSSNGKDTT